MRSPSTRTTPRTGRHAVVVLAAAALVASGCGGPEKAAPDLYTPPVQEADRDSESARKLNSEGADRIAKGDLAGAEDALRRALARDVTFGPAHNNLGKVFFHQKRLYLAAWEFQYAARLLPHRPEPRNNLGLVFEAVGKLDDAVLEYGRALELEPDDPQLVGNLTRARMRRGDRGPEVRKLLQDLLLRETRPDWRAWAEERLGTMPEEDRP